MVEVYFNAHAFGFDIARLYCDRTFLQAEVESVCFGSAVPSLSRTFVCRRDRYRLFLSVDNVVLSPLQWRRLYQNHQKTSMRYRM